MIEVLNFLGRDDKGYSLTEMGRGLNISKATLHAIVGTLLDAGYLTRDPRDRRVALGPMLVPLGRAALGDRVDLVEALRPAMLQLAEEFDAHCTASAAIGDSIVVLSAAGTPSRVRTSFREGQRGLPVEPPIGSLFRCLERQVPHPGVDRQSHLGPHRDDTASQRARTDPSTWLAVAERLEAKTQLDTALVELAADGDFSKPQEVVEALLRQIRSESSTYLVTDYDDGREHDVDWIGVPLFGRDHEVDLALSLINFPHCAVT
ncbi:helix-turn-helix domain-containing protein [Aeromicrobium sp. UC242_57]|uniref:helix-turn-helix domain-containing protein n=1 Tax=Aeromicrobium sp. UC242_57 TaxID=3374624 RepID=UPI0037B35CFD